MLNFWFDELSEAQHWRKDPKMDRHIADRFGDLRQSVLDAHAAGWRDGPDTVLAAIILTDQFSRNMFRGTAGAFAADPLARELSKLALERGIVDRAPRERQSFFLMPLMHSEDLADQERCVAEFWRLGLKDVKLALSHRDQIARFGRFPGRNQALGRVSTPDERAAIEQGDVF